MYALSANARREYYTELGNNLPPPVIHTRENHDRRVATAIETFEALRPANAYEARLAVKIVLCGAHASECLREAGGYREDFAKRMRCRAQAASMMRAECAAKRTLAQEQKVRLAAEAVAGTAPAQPAPASAPPPPAAPRAEPPPVQAAAPAPQPAPMAAPMRAPVPPAAQPLPSNAANSAPQPEAAEPEPAPPPSAEAIEKAEAFAEEDIAAAAQIRHDRGVTPQNKAYFHYLTLPTDPAVIDALVRGTTDTLTLLDEVGGEDLDEAA